jgi:pyrroloquinoline quinone biosynthesis protein E
VALVRSILDQSGLRAVQVSGGEPLLRPDLPDILEGLRPHVASLSLVTDGADLDGPLVATLARLRVGPVQPTLLAGLREEHDAIKGAPCFDRTVEGIARLLRARVPVSVAFVCTRQNADRFADVLDLCFALGVRSVAFSRLCTAGRGARGADALLPEPAQIARCLDAAESASSALGLRIHVAISLPLCAVEPARHPHLRFGRCAVSGGTPGFTLDPAGRLRACSVSSTVLGDLRTEAWDDVVARATEGPLRAASRLPRACAGCALADACGGGCRESAFARHGDWDHADPLARGPVARA